MGKINWGKAFMYTCNLFNRIHGHKWFFCFGTLLTLVRDKGKFKEIDDIDVGVYFDDFEWIHIKNFCNSYGFEQYGVIKDNITKQIMNMSIRPNKDVAKITGEFILDIYAWRKHNGMYWHTYDYHHERPKNGIPSQYVFKGTPEALLDPKSLVAVDMVGGATNTGWVPIRYGTLMDTWYPDWLTKRKCTSSDKNRIDTKSCKVFL